MSQVTRILQSIDGDPKAAEELLPLVYAELRKLTAAKMAQEKPGQTLQATALVHEAHVVANQNPFAGLGTWHRGRTSGIDVHRVPQFGRYYVSATRARVSDFGGFGIRKLAKHAPKPPAACGIRAPAREALVAPGRYRYSHISAR